MNKLILILIFAFSAPFVKASPYTIETIPDVRLQDKYNHVSNPDGIIGADDVAEINQQLNLLEDSLTIEVQVVAVQSIGEEDSRMFANLLFNKWGIGLKGEDNGLLFLLVVDQREIVFETGYGLEGILPDVLCFRFQQEYMVPYLKEDNFSAGMREGVTEVTNYLLSGDYSASDEIYENQQTESFWTSSTFYGVLAIYFIYTFLIVLFLLKGLKKLDKQSFTCNAEKLVMADKKTSLSGKGCLIILNPFSLIFMVILYYLFFRPKLKKNSHICPKCGLNGFQRLELTKDSIYLTDQENFEEKIKSIRHYVYQCKYCEFLSKFNYEPKSKYELCPQCNTKAFYAKKTKTIVRPTYTSTGTSETTFVCKKCNHTSIRTNTIPVRTRTSGGSSSGSGGRSSSRGSSHGGGRSGGGGARSKF